ncbi:hypothetical protein J32TS2_36710 [Shouchella clausii]|jgi:hypothetical protein|nr:hypothetical protein J1TS1_27570 [Shouchella clausii]GIN18315.1 hypothetical protein J32TS2_36710 [Shouchella clausii]
MEKGSVSFFHTDSIVLCVNSEFLKRKRRKEKEQATLACSVNVVVAQLFNVSCANDNKKDEKHNN